MAFFLPTRFYFGINILKKHGKEIILGKKALIVMGKSSAKITGALDDVLDILKDENVEYEIFEGVEENPSFETIRKGRDFMMEKACDFVVGIGGGSPIDASKAISILSKNPNLTLQDLYDKNKYEEAFPIVAIPTTAGTGTEVTQYSVLTDDSKRKKGFGHKAAFPTVSFIDPKYTLKMSRSLTLTTALDALSHSLEGSLSKFSSHISNTLAEKSLELIRDYLPKALSDLNNINYREKLSYASLLGGMVIAQTGTLLPHAMGYRLTTDKDIRHGIATVVFQRFVLENVQKYSPERMRVFHKVFGSIDNFIDFLRYVGVKEFEVKVNEQEAELWANEAIKAPHMVKTPGDYNVEKLKDYYMKAFEF